MHKKCLLVLVAPSVSVGGLGGGVDNAAETAAPLLLNMLVHQPCKNGGLNILMFRDVGGNV